MSSDISSSPSVKWSTGLTPERVKQMAACLLTGCSREETARALGISPRTASRWKKHPAVVAEVERLRNSAGETRVEEVLLDLLNSCNESVVLGAAREILRWKIQRAPEAPVPREADEVVLPLTPGMRWVACVREEPFE